MLRARDFVAGRVAAGGLLGGRRLFARGLIACLVRLRRLSVALELDDLMQEGYWGAVAAEAVGL